MSRERIERIQNEAANLCYGNSHLTGVKIRGIGSVATQLAKGCPCSPKAIAGAAQKLGCLLLSLVNKLLLLLLIIMLFKLFGSLLHL